MEETKEQDQPTTSKQVCIDEPSSSTNISTSKSSSTSVTESVQAESTTDSQPKPDKELLSQAIQSMQHGKRHMIVSDYKSAVPCFEIAAEFLGQCYGLRALECAEAYLNYGSALYEMCKLEEGMADGIVNVEDKPQSDDDEDDDDDDDEEEEEQGGQDGQDGAKEEEEEVEEEVEEVNDDQNEKEEPVQNDSINESSEPTKQIDMDQPSTSKGITASSSSACPSDDENVTNIEIAYEVLTTAREIYSKHLNKTENRHNYAEALQKLGQICIDWENPDGAIELLEECLEHRKSILLPSDRLIAFTYYYLGLAYGFKYDKDQSKICFQKALDVIQLRINNLKEVNTDNMDEFEKSSIESEIEHLQSLIPDIECKIEEMIEQVESIFKTLKNLETENQQEENESRELMKTKPINNVSHLIKRKRPDSDNGLESSSSNSNSTNKKICTSNNGSNNTDVTSSSSSSSSNTKINTCETSTTIENNKNNNQQNNLNDNNNMPTTN